MINSFPSLRFYSLAVLLISCMSIVFLFSFKPKEKKTGILKISFVNTANGKTISLGDSTYQNPFGEQYKISKLKYYISNVLIHGAAQLAENDPYHLINAAGENNSIELSMIPGNYKSISFLLGVDSASNCSGAQTGALDPTNDMFWTWNTGYVMFKLEGSSPASMSDLQRIEHHIGGFKADYNVATTINLSFPEIQIKEGGQTELFIEANLDHYWKGATEIKIAETAVCMSPGKLAKRMASNFSGMFSVFGAR